MYHDLIHLCKFSDEIRTKPTHMLIIFFQMIINHFGSQSQSCNSRHIVRTGTHAFLLPASVDDRFDLYLLINIEEAGSLRTVDLMPAGR